MTSPVRILVVCLGNICRSPLAEGVLRDEIARRGLGAVITVDSAGTGGWHVGAPPDPRSAGVAARHGVSLAGQTARKLERADFQRFDLIFGMDNANVDTIRAFAGDGVTSAQIAQFHEFATGIPREIDDPYYGGADGFETAYRLIRTASVALIDRLEAASGIASG